MKNRIKVLTAALALSAASFEAPAQAFLEIDQVPHVIGLGLGVAPDYKGSDDTTGAIAPFARYTFDRSDRYIQLNATELSLNLINSKEIRFGPVLNYHFGRDDIDDDVVSRMTGIDDTVEGGVFGEIAWIDRGNPAQPLPARRHGVDGRGEQCRGLPGAAQCTLLAPSDAGHRLPYRGRALVWRR
jgi:outer membrane scaffolding protein for murein synthesis (MipA/OmpV family)